MLPVWLLLVLVVRSQAESLTSEEVKEFTDEYFDFRLRENPNYAAEYGVPKYQDQVEEWSYPAFNRRIARSTEFLEKVNQMLEKGIKERSDEVGLKIMKFTLQKYLEGAEYMNYTATLNGDLASMPKKMEIRPITTTEDLRFWYKKVIAYQKVFEDQKDLLDAGLELKLFPTQLLVQGYLDGYRKAIGNSIDDFFAFKPWNTLDIITSNRTFYDEGQVECVKLRDIMKDYADKLENEYLPMCRDMNHTSSSLLPGGDKYYAATLKYFTSEDMTPEKAHDIGLKEVKRITTMMKEIVQKEGFDGTIREFVNTLYNDSNEFFATQALLKQGYIDMLNNKVRPKLHKEFNKEPAIKLDLLDDPYGGIGRHISPKYENGKWTDGVFVYDGSKPHELLKITMLPILVHEAIPGHHYQLSYVLLSDLPDFRKYIAWGHYAQGAFNFPYHGAYAEGWGLYSEYVSEVMGIIETDREKLGRYSLESLRASRLVVDTGLHYYNWTFDEAVNYLVENTIMSEDACKGQIRRYIKWPGQACSYKIGEILIKRLRNDAIRELGSDFDAKAFHQKVINIGACPLDILDEEITHWISQQKATVSAAPLTYAWQGTIMLTTLAALMTR